MSYNYLEPFAGLMDPSTHSFKYKTKLCRHFEAGKCKLGGFCNFAHGQEEIHRTGRKTSKPPEPFSSPRERAPQPISGNFTKITFLEQCLENTYEYQKHSIEKLKFLALEGINDDSKSDEATIELVEANIKALYNTAVEYSRVVKRVAAVEEFEVGVHQFNDHRTKSTVRNNSGSSEELESKICFDSNKNSLQTMPAKIPSLCSCIEEEQSTVKWDLLNFGQKSLARDFIGFSFDSEDTELEAEPFSVESIVHQEESILESDPSRRKPSIFS